LGFVVQMALAVAAGQLLTLLPHRPKEIIIALLFLAGAAYLLFVTEKEEAAEGEREGASEYPSTRTREIMTACSVIFIGEFGDLTQIQAANFAAKYHAPVEIFLTCSLAMIAVACLGAFGGRALQRVVPLEKIRLAGGVVFAVLGLWTLVQAL
jgi:putative Ca2+/H+ antiporter (TMEM165/GDT1 family)